MRDYFDKEKLSLTSFYVMNKKKKSKNILKKIGMIEESVRDKILMLFREKCLFEYFIKFGNWREKCNKPSLIEPEDIEKRK